MKRRLPLIIMSLYFGIFSLGCSSFDRDWEKAVGAPIAPGGLEGPWEGKWTNEGGGHSGKLRCLLTRKEGDQYLARFDAHFWGFLRAGYEVTLAGMSEGPGKLKLSGAEDLGWLYGGRYTYDGHVTQDSFICDYTSKHNSGRFEMARPARADGASEVSSEKQEAR